MGPRAGTEEYMQEQINRLATQVAHMEATQILNHEQNRKDREEDRKDVAELRDGQQRYTDALYAGFKEMASALTLALVPIKKDIFDLQMWKSKTTGYVVGISALAALIFKVVEVGLSKAGLH